MRVYIANEDCRPLVEGEDFAYLPLAIVYAEQAKSSPSTNLQFSIQLLLLHETYATFAEYDLYGFIYALECL